MPGDEKWSVTFESILDPNRRGPVNKFSLQTLIKLVLRGFFEPPEYGNALLQRPGHSEWTDVTQIAELAGAIKQRAEAARVIPGHATGAWTILNTNGREERMSRDQFDDRLFKKRTIAADTVVSFPHQPDEFRPVADCPGFWLGFNSSPWPVRLKDGSEYVANGNSELMEWVRARRVLPGDDVYLWETDEWVKVGPFVNSGCASRLVI
jgi:hypothetical protein